MGSLCLSVCLSMISREYLSASRDFLRLCPKSIHILLPPPSSPIHHHFHHHYTIYIVALYLFLQLGRFHRYSVENIHRQQTHSTNSKQQWSTKIKIFSKSSCFCRNRARMLMGGGFRTHVPTCERVFMCAHASVRDCMRCVQRVTYRSRKDPPNMD